MHAGMHSLLQAVAVHKQTCWTVCSTLQCDVWHQTGRPKNCTVATSMDVGAFWELMGAAMRAADAVSPLNLEIEVNASQCAPRCFTRADHGPAHVAAS